MEKMIKIFWGLSCLIFLTLSHTNAQETTRPLAEKNVLIIAKQDKTSDQYSMEVALMHMFKQYGITTKASLNYVKQGGGATILMEDSIVDILKKQGIDTYLVVTIRGYDKRYSPISELPSLKDQLSTNSIYELYRDGIANVSFSFTFYKDLKPVYSELIRTGTVGSKEAVIEKLLKKVEKHLKKDWI